MNEEKFENASAATDPVFPEDNREIGIGVVGIGLMGSSICACYLLSGHPVVAIAPIPQDLEQALPRIRAHLQDALDHGITGRLPEEWLENLIITDDYSRLADCRIVVETTLEDRVVKKSVFEKIEPHISREALLTSNTSAIPITDLQRMTRYPDRFYGLHWMVPAHTTRFLEVICGDDSDTAMGEALYDLAHRWGKEPILVRKDVPGFVGNRLMYAMYREGMYLVENGYASVEDVDRACRNTAGYYMTIAGIFRWMDLTGIPAYRSVMKDLLPTLYNGTEVPQMIDDLVKSGGKGVANAHGFHEYTAEEAEEWQKIYQEFSYKIRKLALEYPWDAAKKKIENKT